MHYALVFEATTEPYRNALSIAPGLLFLTIGAIMVFKPMWLEQLIRRPLRHRWLFRWSYFLFALCLTIGAATSIISDNLNARSTLKTNSCQIIEGRVEHFHPMPWGGHDTERFDVSGVKFEYSDYIITAGFNKTASHGGPIREGLPVRICFRDGEILRLEIGR